MYLALILVVMSLLFSVIRNKRSNRTKHTVFFAQYVCDETYPAVVANNRNNIRAQDIIKRIEIAKWMEDTQEQEVVKRMEDIRAKEIEKRREEYVEWIDNCNNLFDNKRVLMDQKVCRRSIDNVA